jgi:integrase
MSLAAPDPKRATRPSRTKRAKLSKAFIDRNKPIDGERLVLGDTECKGLILRRSAIGSGSDVWLFAYRVAGKVKKRSPPEQVPNPEAPGKVHWKMVDGTVQRKLKLGEWPALDVDAARTQAAAHRQAAGRGEDPARLVADAIRQRNTDRQAAENRLRLESLLLEYVARGMKGKASAQAVKSAFLRFLCHKDKDGKPLADPPVTDPLGERFVDELEGEDFSRVLEAMIGDKGAGGVAANRLLGSLKACFAWGMRSRTKSVKRNPCAALKKVHKEVERERAFSDEELPAIWKAAEQIEHVSGDVLKLMLLTGARRQEVSEIRRSHIDLDKALWTLPAWTNEGKAGNKARRTHSLPLSPTAVEILRKHIDAMGGQRYRRPSDDHLFIETTSNPPGAPLRFNWKSQQPLLRKLADKFAETSLEHWSVEDARRTVRTGLAALRVAPDVAEMVLNHALSDKLTKTYNRHDYAAEMREALNAWERRLLDRIQAKTENVFALRA